MNLLNFKVLSLAASVSLAALILSGCSPATAIRNLEVSIDATKWSNSLSGETATFSATVAGDFSQSDGLTIGLEAKDSTTTWRAVGEAQPISKPSVQLIDSVIGNPGDYFFRATIFGSDGKAIAHSKNASVHSADLDLEIRKLYYLEAQGCQQSDRACLQAKLSNTYPGLYKVSNAQLASISTAFSWKSQGVPIPGTAVEDNTWVLPVRNCMNAFYGLDVSKPLPGRTFIVSLGDHESHVTYVDGKFYNYIWLCK